MKRTKIKNIIKLTLTISLGFFLFLGACSGGDSYSDVVEKARAKAEDNFHPYDNYYGNKREVLECQKELVVDSVFDCSVFEFNGIDIYDVEEILESIYRDCEIRKRLTYTTGNIYVWNCE